ncbi:MAG TPA: serine/threonine protein kinase [Cyanobacteria bacterium UBA11149]|nr:serine/threonine protein kinase [Cyanobacteria bacterium UBA11367]HBE59031.1 serine/threonine protein kinase [Cyanobacteria bacterium UBA11366]HBK66725.1 serine/threonine protein kinase [Cyanobacteria bacterium UBA11166]HBR76266.1 serine/threonine protein kinase [Cyanobacteria bacterium UBA11159]HBW90220.1 serine/threonine protein kinase [Cyanobacteria bacterium UBA11149]HCA97098.1 serine/threonine protein kinase [Cyanobacteria bacterium UBA9226]
MSYCLNADCPQPKNPPHASTCEACGSNIVLHGKYRVIKTLGQGGFGATFLAKNESLPGHPKCVIKQLRPSSNDPQVMEMAKKLFDREAKTLGRIGNHPQIPTLLDYFPDNQQFYLVQEYVNGSTLQQEIRELGPLPEAGVKQFLSEILPLLEYLHSWEVIHRDIKPANIIRRKEDRKLVLIDFGAVKDEVSQAAMANTSEQTALTHFAIGTPGFAPPEQMILRPVYASDIYAVGVTCIYLLTGKSPKDLDLNLRTGEIGWRKHVQISNHFADVLTKMIEPAVANRYQVPQDILRALDLEPYLESLAGSLVKPISGKSQGKISDSEDLSSPSSASGLSATARMAARIRESRDRRERSIPGLNTIGNPPRLGTSGPKTTVNSAYIQGGTIGKPKPQKFDANKVITEYRKGRRDFACQDLSGLELPKLDLSGGNFREAQLTGANLQGSNLSGGTFSQANLQSANLKDANLVGAFFNFANLGAADLRGADLRSAHISNTNLKSADLSGANLTGAKITEEQLKQAKTNWTTILPNGKRSCW